MKFKITYKRTQDFKHRTLEAIINAGNQTAAAGQLYKIESNQNYRIEIVKVEEIGN
jgi:hypothetical protein